MLRDKTRVDATPERVWAILADPAMMALWNPKCVRCKADDDRVRVGLRFNAVFRLSGPERHAECEVVDCLSGETLTIRFTGDAFRGGGYVDETFRLARSGDGTDVTHEVDFTHSGLPWLLQAFMKVMDIIGHKTGRSSLDCIKELIEPPS